MQGILAAARRRAVQSLRLALMAAPLRLGDLRLNIAVKAPRFKLIPVAGRHCVFEPQIEPHLVVPSDRRRHQPLDGKTQPPVPDRILREAAGFPSRSVEQLPLEHPNRLAGKAQGLALALQLQRFEGDPAERSPRPATDPPTQLDLLELPPTQGEFRVHALNRVSTDMLKTLGCARRELVQIKPGQPLAWPCKRARRPIAGLIAPIPDLIDLDGGGVEPRIGFGLYL